MLTKKNTIISVALISVFVFAAVQGCISSGSEIIELRIFHAGSLSGPFADLETEFESEHNHIIVQRESAGSVDSIRKITDLGRGGDVLASADYSLIESMMINNDPQFASWYIQFAVNRLVIAYTDHSTAKNEITAENWPTIFQRNDVNFGFSNPNADPCGYRSLMMLQLAEKYYDIPNLFEELIQSHSSISVTQDGHDFTIKAPENLDPDSSIMIRPKEVDLMAQLETGELDYLIIYRSVAYQHRYSGVDFVNLPDAIDLSNPNLASDYSYLP
jgi:molybdate/tungstate transport system substrate-binding protein